MQSRHSFVASRATLDKRNPRVKRERPERCSKKIYPRAATATTSFDMGGTEGGFLDEGLSVCAIGVEFQISATYGSSNNTSIKCRQEKSAHLIYGVI